ncbi:Similar to carbon monoxide dehydrogenase corrinoid/iron-sulfur protein [hydrothermal vent metagenome]|uniref:Similar to carbon monoxide dehydrogenase corrinoid/iron-sulfur protein n=1 Tax=hydrothermal vent metagenome TaxID=652676 RepID=A0A3B1CC08_9ZZZZ
METGIGKTSSRLTLPDRLDHFLARVGYKRGSHRVQPGLYSVGSPDEKSDVFVTANYTLSFDAVRLSLDGIDGYILALDTSGVNVWCAAGEGTFGTDELVKRIEATGLADVVTHRKLILPQLGAPGVAAHVVKKKSGFKVRYGPVRANDLPEYIRTGKATEEMRRVRFPFRDRFALIPIELVHVIMPMIVAAIILYFAGGPMLSIGALTAILAGAILFPILLPWLPTREFSTKGFILGGAVALPFALAAIMGDPSRSLIVSIAWGLVYLLAMPSITAFLALNFSGASTYSSRTGVKREIAKYVPGMAYSFLGAVAIMIGLVVINILEVM